MKLLQTQALDVVPRSKGDYRITERKIFKPEAYSYILNVDFRGLFPMALLERDKHVCCTCVYYMLHMVYIYAYMCVSIHIYTVV